MDSKEIRQLLMQKGEKHYKLGKAALNCLWISLGLAAAICLISVVLYGQIYFLDGFAITTVLWIAVILLFAFGGIFSVFYFFGLHYLGMGAIIENTESK